MLIPMAAPARKTFADLALLGEDTHAEVIHGELLQKALPSAEHGGAQTSLLAWLHRRFDRKPGGRWPGGWWIRAEVHIECASSEVHCPDLSGWQRTRMPDRPAGWPVRQRPDWVCEVLSPGHEKRDRVDKLEVLLSAGVPHYWLLDRDEKILQIYRHEPNGYLLVQSVSSGETVRLEPFDAVELHTDIVFGDLDDEE
jgi:Uma2 family endonuclease